MIKGIAITLVLAVIVLGTYRAMTTPHLAFADKVICNLYNGQKIVLENVEVFDQSTTGVVFRTKEDTDRVIINLAADCVVTYGN